MVEYWNNGRLGKEPGSPRKGPGFRGLKPIIPIFHHSNIPVFNPSFHTSIIPNERRHPLKIIFLFFVTENLAIRH